MKIEIKKIPHKYMTISRAEFGFYIGDEIDNMLQKLHNNGTLDTQLEAYANDLYFEIMERFEKHFKEREQ